jgi:ribosome-associated toxin RatA of RatAB toxin-antitoxin module
VHRLLLGEVKYDVRRQVAAHLPTADIKPAGDSALTSVNTAFGACPIYLLPIGRDGGVRLHRSSEGRPMHVLTVDEQLVKTAKLRGIAEREMAVSAEQLFATFEDAHTWPRWVPGMREASWTSPKPFGKGTTRTVKMAGGIRIDEVFWAWEPRRIGFSFAAASIGWVNALAEVYEITPLSPERCELRWTVAVSFRRLPRKFEPFIGRALTMIQKRLLKTLEQVAREYSTSA